MSQKYPWREIQKQNFTSISRLADYLELDANLRNKLAGISHQISEQIAPLLPQVGSPQGGDSVHATRPRPAGSQDVITGRASCQRSGEKCRLIIKHKFPLNLPQRLAQKIKKNRLDDPILRQFVPLQEENEKREGFSEDPVKEEKCRPTPRLLHKYHGRALLLCTSSCAMNCRFCFRRHFPYAKKEGGFERELLYLEQNPSVKEIILSGGDPLSLSNSSLETLIKRMEQIPHLRRLRFHTRFPIGIPERIDRDFLDLLHKSSFQIWFVVHCNHPKELDPDVINALKKVQSLSIPILCQIVLLKGVNDNVKTLKELCELLVDHGFFPYYLHQLDPVEGAAHFAVPMDKGKELMKELATHLPGYALPKYVQEIAGLPGKTIL